MLDHSLTVHRCDHILGPVAVPRSPFDAGEGRVFARIENLEFQFPVWIIRIVLNMRVEDIHSSRVQGSGYVSSC